jgi:hypothetical protein
MSGSSEPFLAVAMSYVLEEMGPFHELEEAETMEIIRKFISGSLHRDEVLLQLARRFPGRCLSSIDKINRVLSVPNQPLPPATDPGLSRQGKRKLNPWTAVEDNRLLAAIHRYGMDNWLAIATFVGNSRSRAQCSQRWNRGLNPHLKKTRWLPEEETALTELVGKYGLKAWTQIAQEMLNRSDVQCRYHFLQMKRASAAEGMRAQMKIMNMESPIEVHTELDTQEDVGFSGWENIKEDKDIWVDFFPTETYASLQEFTDFL